ncbi:hypothetical protein SAMN04488136_14218 [Vibrio xiamenensis]|uniref:tRNA A-37 threonylcarbamoyl transferase component Bud32 n=1 Tax=Vibrio xiamenensis TaxID=861298 RepID=A0A1G8GY60_9VIBR|nr:hypothetical protein [Vibrio xiamenensis]SDH99342.1 hypothetical protein SAMN04488136_14218 [Vibrio xiamenensis]
MQVTSKNSYVYQIETDGRSVWLKKCGEDKRNWFNVALNRLFRTSRRFSHLALYSAYPPKQRFLHELAALEYALERDLPVPKLIFKSRSSFITESSGVPIHQAEAHSQDILYIDAFSGLLRLHQASFIHGRPAMRDIVVNDDGRVTFIDLEEARFSDSAKLKIRDMLLFMLDSYRMEQVSQQTRLSELLKWHQTADAPKLKALNRNIFWLNLLIWAPKLILRFRRNRLSSQLVAMHKLLKVYRQRIKTKVVVDF